MKLLYLRISPFTVAPKKTFSGKLAIASASRNNDPTTLRRQNPHNPLLKTKQHTARRGDAVQRACNLTHAHRPTALVGGASSFPSPLRLSHIPRLISIQGDGLTRSRLSKFPFSFTLSSSRGCRPILHTHHSIWTLHYHCCPILRSEPSISTNYFHSSIRTLHSRRLFRPMFQSRPSIPAPIHQSGPSNHRQSITPVHQSGPSSSLHPENAHALIWTLQFKPSALPMLQSAPSISSAHASIRALQYPIRILAVVFFFWG